MTTLFRTRFLLGALLALVLVSPWCRAQTLQFREGGIVVGKIGQVSTAGLTFTRLDDGGQLQLSWDDLTAACAQRVKRQYGLIEASEEVFRVQADVVEWETPGGPIQTLVGRIVDQDDRRIYLERKGERYPIPRRAIKRLSKRDVEVYEIYEEEGYYRELLAEIEPGADADLNVVIAERLRRAGDVERALEHYEKASELGGGRYTSELPGRIAGVRRLVESGAERELLAEIEIRINRKDFVAAREKIAEFEQRFPEARLATELEVARRRLETERLDELTQQIFNRFEKFARLTATAKLADDRNLSLEAAKSYAQQQMAKDLWARMADVLSDRDQKLDADEVAQLWQNRDRLSRRGTTFYSYGIGSWVLGQDAIIKDTIVEEAREEAASNRDLSRGEQQNEEIRRRLEKMVAEARRKARNQEGQQQTPEDWWRLASRSERIEWLQAYFVEFGAGTEITKAYASPCINCEGVGTIDRLSATGETTKLPCPVCHGTKYTRTFRAR